MRQQTLSRIREILSDTVFPALRRNGDSPIIAALSRISDSNAVGTDALVARLQKSLWGKAHGFVFWTRPDEEDALASDALVLTLGTPIARRAELACATERECTRHHRTALSRRKRHPDLYYRSLEERKVAAGRAERLMAEAQIQGIHVFSRVFAECTHAGLVVDRYENDRVIRVVRARRA